jgi:hypothetical protein
LQEYIPFVSQQQVGYLRLAAASFATVIVDVGAATTMRFCSMVFNPASVLSQAARRCAGEPGQQDVSPTETLWDIGLGA